MGLSHTEIQVTWDTGNNSDTITGESALASDAMTAGTTAIEALIMLKSDMTTGTPASGDYTHFYLLGTLGDPDGESTDEYGTDESHAIYLGTVDHNAEDPGIIIANFPIPLKAFKIYAKTEGLDGGDIVTVSATVMELRST